MRTVRVRARFLEDGLVVPRRYTALSSEKKMVAILHRELQRKIEKVKHMKLGGLFERGCLIEVLFRHHSVQGSHEIAQSNPRNQCESFPAPKRTCFYQALRFFARNYKHFSNIKQRSKGNILVIATKVHWTCFFAITRS